jgi:hypothetical protein
MLHLLFALLIAACLAGTVVATGTSPTVHSTGQTKILDPAFEAFARKAVGTYECECYMTPKHITTLTNMYIKNSLHVVAPEKNANGKWGIGFRITVCE